MLSEESKLDASLQWRQVKSLFQKDPRYQAVESSSQREEFFNEYIKSIGRVRLRRWMDKWITVIINAFLDDIPFLLPTGSGKIGSFVVQFTMYHPASSLDAAICIGNQNNLFFKKNTY